MIWPGAGAPRHLEPGALVEDEADDAAHVEGLSPVAGHDVEQRLLGALRIVQARRDRRQLPDVRREIAEEGTDLPERVRLVLGEVVDDPVRKVDVGSAELLLGEPLPDRALDEGGPPDEDLGVPGHDREVGRAEARRRHSRDRPDADRRHGSRLEGPGHGDEPVAGKYGLAGRPPLPGPGDRTAPALVETDEGELELEGEILDVDALAKPGRVGGAAPQREVLAAHHHRAAVDPGPPRPRSSGG